jgi:hypothetical protein
MLTIAANGLTDVSPFPLMVAGSNPIAPTQSCNHSFAAASSAFGSRRDQNGSDRARLRRAPSATSGHGRGASRFRSSLQMTRLGIRAIPLRAA